jgi:hypothetical protein
MKGDSFIYLPRNRSSDCKMDGGVSVQQGDGGCNGEGLKFVVSLQIQVQRTYCSCNRTVRTQRTAAAPPP